jgi:hypothetical protein
MKSGVRYWLMIAVLVGATTAMAYLSHGESTLMHRSIHHRKEIRT